MASAILYAWTSLWLITITAALTIQQMPPTVVRINHGVIFHKMYPIVLGTTRYRHTFQVPIPTVQYEPIPMIECSTNDELLVGCETVNGVITDMNNRTKTLFARLTRSIIDAVQVIPDIDTASTPADGRGEPSRRKRSQESLGPDYCEQYKNGARPTRGSGFFGTIGKAWSAFWGQPSWEDLAVITGHVCDLAAISQMNADQIKTTSDYMTSVSRTIDREFDNIQGAMGDLNTRITDTNQQLQDVVTRTYSGMDEVRATVRRNFDANNLIMYVIGRLQQYRSSVTELERIVDKFIISVGTLLRGRIDASMIGVEVLSKLLVYVRNRESRHGLTLMETDPAFYYVAEDITFTRSSSMNSLLITVNLPLAQSQGQMMVYRTARVYLPASETDTASTSIHDLPDFLVVSPDGLTYLEMSAADLMACKGKHVKICTSERERRTFDQSTCAAALYRDDTNIISERCDVRYETNSQPSEARRIGTDKYLMHSQVPPDRLDEAHKWTLECPFREHNNIVSIDPCQSCVITVPCGCRFIAPGEFTIGLQLDGCESTTTSFTVEKKFPINLAVLRAVFPTDQLSKQIRADAISSNWEYNIPALRPYQYEWDKSVEAADRYNVDLKKLGVKIAQNVVAYNSKADEALAHATDFQDLAVANVKALRDNLGALEFLSRTPAEVGLAGVSIFIIVSAINFALILYLCIVGGRR